MPKIKDLIETQRFLLRRIEPEDEALYVAIHTDAGLMRNAGGAVEEASARAAFARLLKYVDLPDLKQHAWVINDKADPFGNPIGVTAIVTHAADVEIGAMILESWQGLKVAQEIVPELTQYAFDVHAAQRVFTRHLPENLAGAGVMRRLGFELMQDVPEPQKYVGWVMGRSDFTARGELSGA
ncbi:MAG: hypothetical protein DI562_10280 [Stenotrophomonas acidaminiphila]|nr:MAG: hypothetical protein DI562_10280 [Stenotrophomonas acidaminiphila]